MLPGPSVRWTVICLVAVLAAACGQAAPSQPASGAASPSAAPSAATAAPDGGQTAAPAAPDSYEAVFAAVEGLDREARTEALVEMAQAEGGELLWYAAMQLQMAEALQAAFADTYGINVELYRADKDTVLRRVMEEAAAGHEATADVVEAPAVELTRMSREGLFTPYASDVKDDLVAEAIFDDWTAERFNVFALAWNTDLVGDDPPAGWADLADARFDGQVALNRADVDWYRSLWQHWVERDGMDPEEADRLFQQIAEGGLVMQGHSERAALMAAGDFAVAAPLYTHVADAAIADGAPLGYQPYASPVFLQPNGSALMTAARRPATAVLFLDWLFSEGQQIIHDTGVMSALASLQQGSDDERELIDVEGFIDEEEEWTTRWEDLMRFGELVQQ